MKSSLPSLKTTTRLVARALHLTPDQLNADYREATLEDLPLIIELRRNVLGKALVWDDAAYLQWRYDFKSEKQSGRGPVVVVVHAGRLLGMVGTERVQLVCDGERLTVPSLMDIMIDPELDGTGLGVWLNLAIFARHPICIEIGANPNSLGLITRLYHRLPNRKQYVAPIRWSRVLVRRMRSRMIALPMLPLDILSKAWRAIRMRGLAPGWTCRPIEKFDASVDELFHNRMAPREIAIERTQDYLNWRLFGNPRAQYQVLGLYEEEQMIGYWACQVRDQPDGLRSIDVVDWLVDEKIGINGLGRMLEHAVQWADTQQADYISLTAFHAISERRLRGLGFLRRSHEYNTVGIHCRDAASRPDLLQGFRWFLTDCNTDTDGIIGVQ